MPGRSAPSTLPTDLSPMLATPGALPADDDGWSYEVKWDGVRVLAFLDGGRARLVSRNGNDVSAAYPELAPLADQLGRRRVVLDGEVAAFRADGLSDFGLIQSRMHVRSPSSGLVSSTPVRLMVFDLLHRGDTSLLDRPYDERRRALADLDLVSDAWSVPPAIDGDGPTILASSQEQGLEGIVAKRRSSQYLSGRRSRDGLKIKNIRRTSVVIAGWTRGEGARDGQVGALLLGVYGPSGFEYAGRVGTGFTTATLAMLQGRLDALRADAPPPFTTPVPRVDARNAVWVRPELVAEVDYTEWTRDGRLRHPAFKGLRDDYDPAQVTRE
ncbi:MAG: non-homologous end-joining DNA ligase [Lapillicoccus sp.]